MVAQLGVQVGVNLDDKGKQTSERTNKQAQKERTKPTQKRKVGQKVPNVSLLGTNLKTNKKQGGLGTSGLVSKVRG